MRFRFWQKDRNKKRSQIEVAEMSFLQWGGGARPLDKGEDLRYPGGAQIWAPHQMQSMEVDFWASDYEASWVPLSGDSVVTPHWEETLRKTQDSLEELCIWSGRSLWSPEGAGWRSGFSWDCSCLEIWPQISGRNEWMNVFSTFPVVAENINVDHKSCFIVELTVNRSSLSLTKVRVVLCYMCTQSAPLMEWVKE